MCLRKTFFLTSSKAHDSIFQNDHDNILSYNQINIYVHFKCICFLPLTRKFTVFYPLGVQVDRLEDVVRDEMPEVSTKAHLCENMMNGINILFYFLISITNLQF